ncbi:unnamed protein product [Gemmata massiliana]|uniref:Uncharacterized protein n=1 Tax=Gemmata massiliana TaxID=1210884 RepID=A0A6P2CX73_9BACT|nr:hypothetical protein [Gemmata massiliana]VTR91702.1 unnamed protein product [Gemmata massiliana]
MRPSRGLLDLPPSLWGGYSPQRLVIEPVYHTYRERNQGRFEDGEASTPVSMQLARPADGITEENLSHLLRMCRRAVTWRLEAKPVRCTVLVAPGSGSRPYRGLPPRTTSRSFSLPPRTGFT